MKELDDFKKAFPNTSKEGVAVFEALAVEQERLGKRVEALEANLGYSIKTKEPYSPAPAEPSAKAEVVPSEEDVEALYGTDYTASDPFDCRNILRFLISRGWTPPTPRRSVGVVPPRAK